MSGRAAVASASASQDLDFPFWKTRSHSLSEQPAPGPDVGTGPTRSYKSMLYKSRSLDVQVATNFLWFLINNHK